VRVLYYISFYIHYLTGDYNKPSGEVTRELLESVTTQFYIGTEVQVYIQSECMLHTLITMCM